MNHDFLLNLIEKILTENKKLKGTLSAKYRQGQKAGERQERERIIKLLEGIKVINADQKFFVVQAIKGEQK